jgi:transposase
MRPTGSPEELERRRLRAVQLLEAGHGPAEIGRMLGVTRGAVSQWKMAYQTGGREAVLAKRHPGPTAKLTARQRQQLVKILLKGARAAGYHTELWTLPRIAEVIRQRFGVEYEQSAVWRVLHKMAWSCQKPERRAREADEEAVAHWRSRDWPRIKKRPTKRA